MKKNTITLTRLKDIRIEALIDCADQVTLAVWAKECVKRVLPCFEKEYQEDKRPQIAIQALEDWIETGVFKMASIRKASLDAHAAARVAAEDSAARSVAHAAGQAVAVAHVPRHSLGAVVYALQAVWRAAGTSAPETAVIREKEWQYRRLQDLMRLGYLKN